MSLFQIHPHFGYINSDVKLVNSSSSSIVVKDSIDKAQYTIPGASSITVRLSAGKHLFTVIDNDNISETVVVEDAIKLGGSKEKKSYVFEGTPWAIMVMLDRTYFLNRDTNEQYIEYGLVPRQIHFLTKHYLLFVSKGDNSLFSLDNLSIEKTIGDSSYLFSNDHVAVFSTKEGLALYSLDYDINDRLTIIKCDGFTIDSKTQTLFYHEGDNREIIIRQLDNSDATVNKYTLSNNFYCFIGSHSAVYGASTQALSIIDLQSKNKAVLYKQTTPVTTINSKEIWKNCAVSLIDNKEVKDSFTSFAELEVYERGARWFFIRKNTYVFKNRGSVTRKVKYKLCFTNEEKTYLESEQPLSVIPGKYLDCVKSNTNRGIIVFEKSIGTFEGLPLRSPKGYILVSKDAENNTKVFVDPLNSSYKNYYDNAQEESVFEKTGLVKEKQVEITSTGRGFFYGLNPYRDIDSGCKLEGSIFRGLSVDGFFCLSDNGCDNVYSLDNSVSKMPCLRDRLVSISEKCNYSIVRSENGIELLAYNQSQKRWEGTALKSIVIDKSFYSKAVFCSDGENIIYQKDGGEKYFLRKIGSDYETEFEYQSTVIRRNLNGYIPYLDFDSHRRPVYVDPVSLTRVEYEAIGQFMFQSVDGKITHLDHNHVKYYSKEKKRYVLQEEYDNYVAKFDYETNAFGIIIKSGPHYEQAKNNRIKYFEEHKRWLIEVIHPRLSNVLNRTDERSIFNAFIEEYASICDNVIFKKEYYIREKMGDEIIEINIPYKLYFLNYVSYSYDNRYIIIAGRFPTNFISYKGLALVYDVEERKVVYISTSTMAVWLGVFSKNGAVAYYDSTPNTFLSEHITSNNEFKEIEGRSFLTFSPSGKYIALSKQGYIPFISGNPHWGHQPSRDVYVVMSSDPSNELAHFLDHGEQIEGTGDWDRTNYSVASATFSKDDKKLMTVSKDGVVVIRNLHLDDVY